MTEQTILQAAKTVFLRKGLDGATMQDIADEAEISRTLLNYYHRKKESLFRAILTHAVGEFIPKLATIVELEAPLIEKIERIVDAYNAYLLDDPILPHFMMMEIQRDPRVLVQLFRDNQGKFGEVFRLKNQIVSELHITDEAEADAAFAHLFASFYGLLMFPFLAKPALDVVFFKNDSAAFSNFLNQHKPYVISMMRTLLDSMTPAATAS